MNSPLMFLPSVICLCVALGGFVFTLLAAFCLRKIQASAIRQHAQAEAPPVLAGEKQRPAALQGWWVLCLKGLLAAGLGAFVLGLLGVWSTKLSLGWKRNSAVEWSDGHAPELESLIRQRCVPFMRGGKSLGLAVAVVTPTRATIMTFGRPALSAAGRTGPDTLFEIGSITKTFTGLALAREIEQGMVRLDQPVQELLPAGVVLPEAARSVTLRHLTTHTSGFPRVAGNAPLLKGVMMLLFGSDPYSGYTEAGLLETVRGVKLEFKTGTKHGYSNFGMMLLGHLLARKANCSYEALIRRDVCRPLGMDDTTVTLERGQTSRRAQGYRALLRWGPLVLGLRSAPWFEGNDLGGAGALGSTPADMLKYLQANLRPEGQPIEHALRESHRVLFKEDERMAIGMNWIRTQDQPLKQTVIWHNGGTGGFRSFLGFTERSGVGVVVLSNVSESVDELSWELLRDLADWAAGHDPAAE